MRRAFLVMLTVMAGLVLSLVLINNPQLIDRFESWTENLMHSNKSPEDGASRAASGEEPNGTEDQKAPSKSKRLKFPKSSRTQPNTSPSDAPSGDRER